MFDYTQNFKKIDFRENPELYRVGIGEQGALLVEPYKSELLPYWRFKNPEEAKKSSKKLLTLFRNYLKEEDFAGMDMARKFIQMGYTRSRRYANHKSGKKYDGPVPRELRGISGSHGREILPRDEDLIKAESARIFKKAWERIERNHTYTGMRKEWKQWYG